jgi:putative DNA primase/helicase
VEAGIALNEFEVISSFIDAMRAEGVNPADSSVIRPGHFIRFQIEGEARGKKSGWCIFHADEYPAGRFGDHRRHGTEGVKWKHRAQNPGRELSEEERKAFADRMKAKEREREAAIKALHREAAGKSRVIWSTATTAPSDHPYLVRKNVKPHIARLFHEVLVIPVTKNRDLVGLQFIAADGEKKFKFGTDIRGAYATIGTPKDQVIICEGFSTAASIHEATGIPVIIAFNASNLEPVSTAIRDRLPESQITIAVDDDRFPNPLRPQSHVNAGVTYGSKAASLVNGRLVRPHFKKDDDPSKPTDFNDVANLYGSSEVKRQIETGSPSWSLPVEVIETASIAANDERVLRDEFPHMRRNKDGEPTTPLSTIENVQELLRRLGANARYNVIKKEIQVSVPGLSFIQDKALSATFSYIRSKAAIARIPLESLDEFIHFTAFDDPINPVMEWIKSKPWDGVSRLPEFYATVTAKDEKIPGNREFKETLIKRWMLSAVAAASRPNGVSAHGVLVFQAPQYLGKTAWFKRLAPPELKVIADGLTLDLKDKDSIYRVLSHWLVELGEIDATFKKSDISALKAFITRDFDSIRRPYDRAESNFPRRTIFFGSVNEKDYLHDPTGNRRYWTIAVEDLNHQHTVDMQQVWAEFEVMLSSGESIYLTPEEMLELNSRNKGHEVVDPIVERVREAFDWSQGAFEWRRMSATQISQAIGIMNPTARDSRSAARAIREITGQDGMKSDGRIVFNVPNLKSRQF